MHAPLQLLHLHDTLLLCGNDRLKNRLQFRADGTLQRSTCHGDSSLMVGNHAHDKIVRNAIGACDFAHLPDHILQNALVSIQILPGDPAKYRLFSIKDSFPFIICERKEKGTRFSGIKKASLLRRISAVRRRNILPDSSFGTVRPECRWPAAWKAND